MWAIEVEEIRYGDGIPSMFAGQLTSDKIPEGLSIGDVFGPIEAVDSYGDHWKVPKAFIVGITSRPSDGWVLVQGKTAGVFYRIAIGLSADFKAKSTVYPADEPHVVEGPK